MRSALLSNACNGMAHMAQAMNMLVRRWGNRGCMLTALHSNGCNSMARRIQAMTMLNGDGTRTCQCEQAWRLPEAEQS